NIVEVVCVVPIPGDLSWFDPGRILHLRWFCEQKDQLVSNQVAIILCDTDDAPGKCASTLRRRNVACRLGDTDVTITAPGARSFLFEWIRRENSGQTVVGVAMKPKSWIVLDILFHVL